MIRNIYETSFNDTQKLTEYLFCNKFEDCRTLYHNGCLTSIMFIIMKNLRVYGTEKKFPFIVGAATREDARGQGHFPKLMESTIRSLYSKGIGFMGLYPVKHSYYRNLGFSVLNYIERDVLISTNRFELRKIENLEKIVNIYNKDINSYNIFNIRTYEDWKIYAKGIDADDASLKGIYDKNELVGYVVYDDEEIREYSDINLLYGISELNGMRFYKMYGDEPYAMWRVVNPISALKGINTNININIFIAVRDYIDTIMHVFSQNGKLLVESSNHYDEEYGVEEFGAVIAGKSDKGEIAKIFRKSQILFWDKYI